MNSGKIMKENEFLFDAILFFYAEVNEGKVPAFS